MFSAGIICSIIIVILVKEVIGMRLGLCLTGGGAKGAFQGGVIKGLNESNVVPEIVTGTSIGAVNTYFMIKGCYDELEMYWNQMELNPERIVPGRVIDNSQIINKLYGISGNEERIKAAYINYVHIEDKKLSEIIVNIKELPKKAAINAVKYSSLLPSRPEDFIQNDKKDSSFDSRRSFNNFQEDMENGIYEGYNLDGGILNNNLLSPLISEGVGKIIIIGLSDKFTPPEYIYKHYNEGNIIVLKPDIEIHPTDTIRFQKSFCSDLYERGYRLSRKIKDQI